MSIEHSIFNSKEEASRFVENKYGIIPTEVERLYGGSANCYRLTVASSYYFLKEFQPNFDKAALLREAKVCQLLAEKGIPTSVFIKTKKNDDVCAYRGRIFHLQTFIHGKTLGKLQESQLMKSAEMLATIHNALESASFLKLAFRESWFDEWTKEISIEKHEEIIRNLPLSKKAMRYQECAAQACRVKMGLLQNYQYDTAKFKLLKTVNTHGDYNHLQLLWDENGKEIKAVVDFSNAAKLPAVWEIVRSYTLSAKECEKGDYISKEGLWAYVKTYLEKAELSLFDIENMIPFYYHNLLRNTYGLDLTSRSGLEFALWRTRICQYLYLHGEEITQYLCQKYLGFAKPL